MHNLVSELYDELETFEENKELSRSLGKVEQDNLGLALTSLLEVRNTLEFLSVLLRKEVEKQ